MTRRQIYFFEPKNSTYYVSDEFNGDKEELEYFGSCDRCDKTWAEMIDEFSSIQTLCEFMKAITRMTGYYHSTISPELPGVRMMVKHTLDSKDETYGIISGIPGVFLDKEFSGTD